MTDLAFVHDALAKQATAKETAATQPPRGVAPSPLRLAGKAKAEQPTFAGQPVAAAPPAPLQPFTPGALGNFPYFWEDPNTLRLNERTYQWIDSCLRAGASPITLGEPFTNLYIRALGSVSYQLSTADQAKLSAAHGQMQVQQTMLLEAWRSAFGSLPTGPGPIIDQVLNEVTTVWAHPPTTIAKLRQAPDLTQVLNQMPAAGASVLPALSRYLAAFPEPSLLNASSMYTGYLAQALQAVQSPTTANGAVVTSDGVQRPAYQVATPLAQILQGLNDKSDAGTVSLKLNLQRTAGAGLKVGLVGQPSKEVPADDVLQIATAQDEDLLAQLLPAGGAPSTVEVTFHGVTRVYFGPVAFNLATQQNWYWIDPITGALQNAGKDVSGFHFSPNPQIDFSRSGPFAFLTAVSISKHQVLRLVPPAGAAAALRQAVPPTTGVKVSLLGQPLATGGASAGHTAQFVAQNGASAPALQFSPTPSVAADGVNSTAYVLGVQPDFPAA